MALELLYLITCTLGPAPRGESGSSRYNSSSGRDAGFSRSSGNDSRDSRDRSHRSGGASSSSGRFGASGGGSSSGGPSWMSSSNSLSQGSSWGDGSRGGSGSVPRPPTLSGSSAMSSMVAPFGSGGSANNSISGFGSAFGGSSSDRFDAYKNPMMGSKRY